MKKIEQYMMNRNHTKLFVVDEEGVATFEAAMVFGNRWVLATLGKYGVVMIWAFQWLH